VPRAAHVLPTPQYRFEVAAPTTTAPSRPSAASAFRSALGDPALRVDFVDLPVDWYDTGVATWRPTAVAATAPAWRGGVDVYVPIDDGIGVMAAAIDSLRLSAGSSDAVSRFWVTRYRLRLLRQLATLVDTPEREAVDTLADELAPAEAELRDVWLTAFAHGAPPRAPRTLLRPSSVRLAFGEAERSLWPGGRAAGSLVEVALLLHRSERRRLERALTAAGVSADAVARHPLCALLMRLTREPAGPRARDAGKGSVLDPAVWRT